jgi:hypothetical protein
MTPVLGIIASSNQQGRGGLVGSYDALASVVVPSGGLASIVFAGIPAGYENLEIRYQAIAATGGAADLKINFNGDTSASYSYQTLYSSGSSTVSSLNSLNTTRAVCGANGLGSSTYSSYFGAGIININNYASVSVLKTIRTLNGFDTNNGTTNINNETISMGTGLWFKTPEAITTITLASDSGVSIAQNSVFSLYGVK